MEIAMSTEEMQKEFEAAVALEAGEPILAIYLSRRNDTYSTSTLHFAWWAWKASRAALSVELPAIGPTPDPPEDAFDDSYLDAHHASIRMRNRCLLAIDSLGLKVK
jgi:hypothetical protein